MVGLEEKLMVPLGMRDILARFADMVDRNEDVIGYCLSKPLSDKVPDAYLIRSDGDKGISIRQHLVYESLIVGLRIPQVKWIAIVPEESLMHFRVPQKLLPDVIKTVTEFLNMSSWSHLVEFGKIDSYVFGLSVPKLKRGVFSTCSFTFSSGGRRKKRPFDFNSKLVLSKKLG